MPRIAGAFGSKTAYAVGRLRLPSHGRSFRISMVAPHHTVGGDAEHGDVEDASTFRPAGAR